MTVQPVCRLLGDCEDAREHFGIDATCDPATDHHPSRLVEVACPCGYQALLCPAVAHDAAFVLDACETYDALVGFLGGQLAHVDILDAVLDEVERPPALVELEMADPIGWAAANGIPYFGEINGEPQKEGGRQ